MPELQKKLLPLFHYALNPGGFLFLGNSETAGEFTGLFEVVDRKSRLCLNKGGTTPHTADIAVPAPPLTPELAMEAGARTGERERRTGVREVTEKALLRDYAPACVTVNERQKPRPGAGRFAPRA